MNLTEIATRIAAGMAANPLWDDKDWDECAREAVEAARALLKELNK